MSPKPDPAASRPTPAEPVAGVPVSVDLPDTPADVSAPTPAGKPKAASRRAAASKTATAAAGKKAARTVADQQVDPVPPAAKPTKAAKTVKTSKGAKPVKEDKPSKAARKAAEPTAPAAPAKPPSAKVKMVRDSFTMPSDDFALIERIKARALEWKQPVKKSEVLRVALHALVGLSDARLKAALAALAPIKKGRPKQG